MLQTLTALVCTHLCLGGRGSLHDMLQAVFANWCFEIRQYGTPATSTVLVGYPTTLRCSARDPTPPDDILWFKDGVTVTPGSRFTISYDSSAGDSQLRISSVRYPDSGGYQCIAVGSSNQILAASSVGTLTVHGKQHEYTSYHVTGILPWL